MTKNQAFEEFSGQLALENDAGWTKEVWDAAWDACEKALKEQLINE